MADVGLFRYIKVFWHRVSMLGVKLGYAKSDIRNIILTNRLAFILMLLSILLVIMILSSFGWTVSAPLVFSSFVIYLSTLWLNALGRVYASRLLLSWGVPVATLVIAITIKWYNEGAEEFEYFDSRLILLVSAIIPLVVFDFNDLRLLIFSIIPSILCLLVYDTAHNLAGVGYRQMGLESDNYSFISLIVLIAYILLVGSLLFLRSLSVRAERRLAERNNLLRSQNAKLTDLNRRIEVKNEEIEAQTEELLTSQEKLEKANQVITQQKEQLQLRNQDLESELVYKNERLTASNRELVQHNLQLRQLTYTISHNLRGPVARLLGLSKIFDRDVGHPSNVEMMNHIEKSAQALDVVIRDLTKIIEINNDITSHRAQVQLDKELAMVCTNLEDKIEQSNATIIDDLRVKALYSVRAYIQSIFHNLISNAIKYRSVDRPLKIEVSSQLIDDEVIISIMDNGLGIDLRRFEGDLFKMYKRFHTHTAGKGLGLYLTKLQVETLGGRILVDSEIGKGTCFQIRFPQ